MLRVRGVFKVDLSDDASFLATGDGEGLAHVWDLGSAQRDPYRPRDIPPAAVPAGGSSARDLCRSLGERAAPQVALSPDGRLLATGASDGTVRIWDIATGAEAVERPHLRSLEPKSSARRLLARGPDVQSRRNPPVLRALRWRRGASWTSRPGTTFPWPPDQLPGCDQRRRLPARLHGVRSTHPDRVSARTEMSSPGSRRTMSGSHPRANDARLDGIQMLQGHTLPIISGGVQRRRHTTRDRKPRRDRSGVEHVDGENSSSRRRSNRATSQQSRSVRTGLGSRRSTRTAGSSSIRSRSGTRSRSPEARVTRGLTAEECRRYLHVPTCPAD